MTRRRKRAAVSGSRIEADRGQGVLLEVAPHPVEAEAHAAKRCTAALLWERDRETYEAVVRALAECRSIRQIKRDFGLGTDTVMAIRRREWKEVGTLKGVIADTLLHGAAAGAERAAELVSECEDPVAAAMATKMLAETSQLMRGQATKIEEQRVVVVDSRAVAAAMRERLGMGLGAGENLSLGAGGPAERVAGLVGEGSWRVAADSLSAGLLGDPVICHGSVTGLAGRAVAGTAVDGGGGGELGQGSGGTYPLLEQPFTPIGEGEEAA